MVNTEYLRSLYGLNRINYDHGTSQVRVWHEPAKGVEALLISA
jgi:hypothetical protein